MPKKETDMFLIRVAFLKKYYYFLFNWPILHDVMIFKLWA